MLGQPHSVGMMSRSPHCKDTVDTNAAHHGHDESIRVPRGSGRWALYMLSISACRAVPSRVPSHALAVSTTFCRSSVSVMTLPLYGLFLCCFNLPPTISIELRLICVANQVCIIHGSARNQYVNKYTTGRVNFEFYWSIIDTR